MVNLYSNLIQEIKKKPENIARFKQKFCRDNKVAKAPSNTDLFLSATKKERESLKNLLISKPVRTASGVAPIAIMSAPFHCAHGKCTFCPGGPNSYYGNVPQSYTGHEPTTMRATRNQYDSYLQVFNRLEQYAVLGHNYDKVELIVMGGTFPSLREDYQNEFICGALKAMNDFSELFFNENQFNFNKFKQFFGLPGEVGEQKRTDHIHQKLLSIKHKNSAKFLASKSPEAILKQQSKTTLLKEQQRNETAKIRCVAMCIETKPDWGFLDHGNKMLEYGCTRVEIGVQSVYDDVLKKVNRGHDSNDTKKSFQILKDLGFKISAHYMPGLPLTDEQRDLAGFKELFENTYYRPDMLKLYPCMVAPGTALYYEWKAGKFVPLAADQAARRIVKMKKFIPRYCRVQRILRDVPTKMWAAGVEFTNLRQYIHQKYKPECECIRCREPMGRTVDHPSAKLHVLEYDANNGKESFISIDDTKNDIILGFCRLRFPSQFLRKEITECSALIRELHVYGTAAALGEEGIIQHKGYGKMLMAKAEEIAKQHGKKKMIVISGIGAREYYKKLGYTREGPYMTKMLNI